MMIAADFSNWNVVDNVMMGVVCQSLSSYIWQTGESLDGCKPQSDNII